MTEQSSKKGHKEHLSKDQRLPRSYKDAEKVLKAAKTCQGNIKTILYNTKFRGGYFNKIYALTHNVLKNTQLLDKIIEETHLLTKEPYLKNELAQIMIYDMVLGKGQLSGKSKPVLTILKYKNDIEDAYQCLSKAGIDSYLDKVTIPRYARINTLLTTMSDVLDDLKNSGYYHKEYQEDISEDVYLDMVKNLKLGEFLIDYHFKDLLVFPCRENLRAWDLYSQGHIFLQDKSSCIPVCVLSPEPGSNVVDACAAPGMKTVHLAGLMKNKGQIFAYEKDSNRFDVLKSTLTHGNVKICKTYCKDFRTVDPADDKNSNIDYILLDPTCSGSGMVSRMDAATDTENSKNEERLQNLAGFQIVLLKHALKFPNVKRVVYSTCSVTEEENEYVVHEVLNNFQDQFRLVKIMPDWSIRGSEKYEYGNLCLRAYPDKNLTNGFFVAMFERIELSEVSNSNTLIKMSKCKKNKSKRKSDYENDKDFLSSSQKQFKNNNYSETNADDINSEQKEKSSQSETLVKKKYKKKHKSDKIDIQYQTSNDERKSFCEEDDFSLPVLQKKLQRNNYLTSNRENLNLEQAEKTEGTHQPENHAKKKHKKKNNFGKTDDGREQKSFVKNENGDDFHSSTSQKQYYRNANIENVSLEQMEKTETCQSEIHVKKKCKKKHKSDETDNSEKKNECLKYEDGNDFHSLTSEKHDRNIYSTSNVNLEETENKESYQSNTHVKKKCKKKHKSDDKDMQYIRSNSEEKSNCDGSNDFFSSASQKHHQKSRFAANDVENVDLEQKEERKETYISETHVKKKCKKKHKSSKTDLQDSQEHYQKNNCEEVNLENSKEKEKTYELKMHIKKKCRKKSIDCNEGDIASPPNSITENVKKMKKCNF